MAETKTSAWKNFRLQNRSAESAGPISGDEYAPQNEPKDVEPSVAFFQSGAVFEGTLKLSGDFRVESEFKGKIITDGVIVVSRSGSVEGDIEARQVEIEGAVVGNVTARRLLIVKPEGRLHGDIETACLEIHRHAFFQGATKMILPLSTNRNAETFALPATPTKTTKTTAKQATANQNPIA